MRESLADKVRELQEIQQLAATGALIKAAEMIRKKAEEYEYCEPLAKSLAECFQEGRMAGYWTGEANAWHWVAINLRALADEIEAM